VENDRNFRKCDFISNVIKMEFWKTLDGWEALLQRPWVASRKMESRHYLDSSHKVQLKREHYVEHPLKKTLNNGEKSIHQLGT
jgi:hypothetical protein